MPTPSYHADPGFLQWRRWVGTFILSLGAGLIALSLATEWASFGYILVLFVPFSLGWILGMGTMARAAFLAVLGGCLMVGLGVSAMTLDLSGMMCTLILAAMVLLPLVVGILLGHLLRRRFEREKRAGRPAYSLAFYLPALLLLYGEPMLPYDDSIEVIQTTRVYAMAPDEVWSRIAFYEDVDLVPPRLARIGLPTPVRTVGAMHAVGDLVTCEYETGHLVKEITAYEPGRLLAFDVIEQVGIEDRSIELEDGSFQLRETPDGTEVTLTTRFRPLLSARVFWRPFERSVARALHNHVLDGMEPGSGLWTTP